MSLAFLTAELELMTPLFLGGADSKATDAAARLGPELRPQLRFWYRAAAGPALNHNTGDLFAAESDLFGAASAEGTDAGSTFSLRLNFSQPWLTGDFMLVPHKTSWAAVRAFRPNQRVEIRFLRRSRRFVPDKMQRHALTASLWLATHFGGVGKRSRRAAGAFSCVKCSHTGLPFNFGENAQGVGTTLNRGLKTALSFISAHAIAKGLGKGRSGATANPDYFHLVDSPGSPRLSVTGVWVGTSEQTPEDHRQRISNETHTLKGAFPGVYAKAMGTATPSGRLSSPVWFRVVRTDAAKSIIVATVSGSFDRTPSTGNAAKPVPLDVFNQLKLDLGLARV